MKTLIAKEFRQLLPIASLWLALIVFGYLTQLAGARIDEQSFASWCAEYCQPGVPISTSLFYIGLILITAYSLFPREYDEATIDFLRSLPVSAAQIFLAKLLAAWLLLAFLSAAGFALNAALLSLNPQSIDGLAYPVTALHFLLRDILFLFIILAHGIFISWFRTIGLILYVAYLVGIVWAETQLGATGAWNVLRVLENEYSGQTLLINLPAMATHLSVAIVLLGISYRMWSRQETNARGKSRSRSMPRWLTVLGNMAAFGVLAVLLLGYLQQASHTGGENGDSSSAVEKHSTRHFRFSFTAAQRPTMEYLALHGDEDVERLAALLGSEQHVVIDADLTAESDHLLGLAQWKRIKMDVSGFESDEKYRRVLSHETVHVFQAVESDRALADYGNATRFFIEGMAQYVSFELVPEPARLRWNRQLAAIAWQRQRIRFANLIDDASFSRQFDADLYYSVGETWTAALVAACGEPILGKILRAAGRPGASRSLGGAAFWRDTLQAAGCELESVNARWRQAMQREFDAADTAAFPTFDNVRISASESGDTLVIRADVKAVDAAGTQATNPAQMPERWQLRVASDTTLAASVPRVYYGKRLNEAAGAVTVEYRVPRAGLSGARFRYQLGYTPDDNSRNYFERWQAGSTTAPP